MAYILTNYDWIVVNKKARLRHFYSSNKVVTAAEQQKIGKVVAIPRIILSSYQGRMRAIHRLPRFRRWHGVLQPITFLTQYRDYDTIAYSQLWGSEGQC